MLSWPISLGRQLMHLDWSGPVCSPQGSPRAPYRSLSGVLKSSYLPPLVAPDLHLPRLFHQLKQWWQGDGFTTTGLPLFIYKYCILLGFGAICHQHLATCPQGLGPYCIIHLLSKSCFGCLKGMKVGACFNDWDNEGLPKPIISGMVSSWSLPVASKGHCLDYLCYGTTIYILMVSTNACIMISKWQHLQERAWHLLLFGKLPSC